MAKQINADIDHSITKISEGFIRLGNRLSEAANSGQVKADDINQAGALLVELGSSLPGLIPPDLVDTKQMCGILSCSRTTLHHLVKEKVFPPAFLVDYNGRKLKRWKRETGYVYVAERIAQAEREAAA